MKTYTLPREAFKKELATEELFEEHFKMIDKHFKRLNLKLNVFIVIFIALTLINPTFIVLVEKLF